MPEPDNRAVCRPGCGACCIAPSISSALPGMAEGKPAGVRCPQLTDDNRCRIFGLPERPSVCSSLQPSPEMCGATAGEALALLGRMERATAPGASAGPGGKGPGEMPFRVANLLKQLPDAAGAEVVESIVRTPGVLIERIVSQGQATPEGEWYDQERAEWVMLVSGSAGLLFDGEQKPHRLEPGDHLLIPAHCRHRVAWTDPEKTTVWLAVHVGDER